jgi:hypothetical protein
MSDRASYSITSSERAISDGGNYTKRFPDKLQLRR